jgi:hypothetical protein
MGKIANRRKLSGKITGQSEVERMGTIGHTLRGMPSLTQTFGGDRETMIRTREIGPNRRRTGSREPGT